MKIIVIGAGAAGMIAAGRAAEDAEKVILIERNDFFGKKLRITGKGRCNITNSAETEDMINMYPTNAKFLYSALYTFGNYDITALLKKYGVETKTERGGRIFPVSDKAEDVVKALRKYALKSNVTPITARVKGIIAENGEIKGVKLSGKNIYADRVIVCTGGVSYPNTGSTGDGYDFAREAGHTVIPPKPSLVPLVTEEKWVRDLMGLGLKNIAVTLKNDNGKKVYEDFGELLFTHFGVSGPVVLSMSSHIKNINSERHLEIDLKPALDEETLDARILRDFEKYSKKHLVNALDDLLPKALVPVVIKNAELEEHKAVCEITHTERLRLVHTLKHLSLTLKAFRPVEEAIVTSGGVKVSEINPSTMESKKVKGLYFAGEVIDVDGYTGGYNLQAAFSTGYLAGMSAAQEE